MANNERLTKRVKKIEEWVAENEEMGGPKGYMDTFVHLYNRLEQIGARATIQNQQFEQLRAYVFQFVEKKELGDEWNEFLKEKDNAVQEQQAEEVPAQEEAESGEEAVEAPEEEKE